MAVSSRLAVFLVVALVITGIILVYAALPLFISNVPVEKKVSQDDYISPRAQATLDVYDADSDPYITRIVSHGSDDSDDDDGISGLVAYFDFDEAFDSDSFEDSENNYEARCSGTLCPESGVTGHDGKALSFDGTNDLVVLENAQGLRFSDSFSVAFWFKGRSSSHRQFLVGTWDGTANTLGWHADVVRGGICEGMDFYVSEDGTSGDDQHRAYRRTCDQTYMDNDWHHYVGVFDSNERLEMYIDGDLVGTTVGNVSALDGVFSGTGPIRIGSGFGYNTETGHFEGLFDELYLFDRALSADDVDELYDN